MKYSVLLILSAACAASTTGLYEVTETSATSSVPCGPIAPVQRPEDVCIAHGGVDELVHAPDGSWYDFGCRDGLLAWGHVEGTHAYFDLTTDVCESEYEMELK